MTPLPLGSAEGTELQQLLQLLVVLPLPLLELLLLLLSAAALAASTHETEYSFFTPSGYFFDVTINTPDITSYIRY